MLKYTIKRLLQLIPTLIIVSFIVFSMVRLIPGDPITLLYGLSESGGADEEYLDYMRDQYGLNDPLVVQYANWIGKIFKGDLGTSLYTHKPIITELANRYKNTIILAVGGTVVGSLVGMVFGIIAAINHNKFGDNVIMVFSMLAVSTPSFFLAMLLMLFFSLKLGWLPSGGNQYWYSIILPALTIGWQMCALMTRMTRSSMLEVIRQDYINTARAKGLSEKMVVLKHALRNALIPNITSAGDLFVDGMGGAVVTETIFSWPGVGRLMVDSISKRDLNMVIGCVIMTTVLVTIGNLVIDIIYAFVDPRIRSSYTGK